MLWGIQNFKMLTLHWKCRYAARQGVAHHVKKLVYVFRKEHVSVSNCVSCKYAPVHSNLKILLQCQNFKMLSGSFHRNVKFKEGPSEAVPRTAMTSGGAEASRVFGLFNLNIKAPERQDGKEQTDQTEFIFHSDLYRQAWDKRVLFESQPKTILHNMLVAVSNHFGSKKYRLPVPILSQDKFHFICKYKILWPKSMDCIGLGFSKKEADYKCALNILKWLKEDNYIDDFGKPIFRKRSPDRFSKSFSQVTGSCKGIKQREVYDQTAKPWSPQLNVKIQNDLFSPSVIQTRSYSVDINENSTESENKEVSQQIEGQDLNQVCSVFSRPKNVLHNCMNIAGQALQQKDLTLSVHYVPSKNKKNISWTCTYSLKWPEAMKLVGVGRTKQEASHKASVVALAWLMKNNKITKDGRPVIFDKQEVTKLKRASYPVIMLDKFVENKLNQIVDLYQNNLVVELDTELDSSSVSNESSGEELNEKWPAMIQSRQAFKGLQFYETNEPEKLPISDFKEKIMDLSENNQILIIKGEPGCGKSTRVPQYVLEAWAKSRPNETCRIVVTQPRRIAAISLAERVADERGETVGSTIGYHVRLRSNFNQRTGRIMYCTTGILLRRLQSDPKLTDCSHIILDEAHERDVNTDLLMNLVRHAMQLNPNLKVLVMSATMDAEIFQKYFNGAPIINIPGFTYPVKEYYLDKNRLPKTDQMCLGLLPTVVPEEVVKTIQFIHRNKHEGAILCFLPGWDEIMKVRNLIPERKELQVLCLHSKLQISEQKKIFNRPPPGVRKIILATNIAETSITVDDVVYVIDTGIHKEERFDIQKGVNIIDNYWISQASAIQRKGRAGRCQAGECFRLYPKTKFEQLQEYSIPEILRTSLAKIVLDSKVYSNNMNAVDFLEQLVCPPEKNAVEKAVDELKELELLDENENLTSLGRTVSEFQLAPKLSKAMINAVIFKCVTPIVDIATLFSADSAVFANTLSSKLDVKDVKLKFSKTSDHLAMMKLFEMWLNFVENGNDRAASEFCYDARLVPHKLETLQKLRIIHYDYLRKGLKHSLMLADDFSDNNELVKAVLLSGVGTVLQHRTWDIVKGLFKKTNILLTRHNQKATITSESVNSRRGKFPSSFLLYINETISNLRHTTLVRETSVISPLAVLLFRTGKLEMEEISETDCTDKLDAKDPVLVKIQGTKIAFYCDRRQAIALRKCKEAINGCVQYYIYQLTKRGEKSPNIDLYWNEILQNLNQILNKQSIKD